jgi:hypothetical protein
MLGHHFDRLAPKQWGDVDIDLMSPELVKHMLDRPTALNDKVIMGGKMVLFKNTPGGERLGFWEIFPEFEKFSARWQGILGREVNIKPKAELTPISEVPKPERGPIEIFRQEAP